jgi:hypothetical protein
MIFTHKRELDPAEKKLPIAKYYDLPLHSPGPLQQQIINACPIHAENAIQVEDFINLLQPAGYSNAELGCCMMPDGSGYIAAYTVYPDCTPMMLAWYFRWMNVHAKGMPEGHNLKYKIWNAVDHVDHGFVNGKDRSGGIYQVEALDMGQGDEPFYSIRHPFRLRDYGLTENKEKELNAAGCFLDCAVEKFYTVDPSHQLLPGTHLTLTLSRFCPYGGMEKRTREWIGYGVEDGELYFDASTPAEMLNVGYMKKVLYHNVVEAQQLNKILPSLYAEYHEKPDDAF